MCINIGYWSLRDACISGTAAERSDLSGMLRKYGTKYDIWNMDVL